VVKSAIGDSNRPRYVWVSEAGPPKAIGTIGSKPAMAHGHAPIQPENAGANESTAREGVSVNCCFFRNKVCEPDSLIREFLVHWPSLAILLR
jgi:hypothetical protein